MTKKERTYVEDMDRGIYDIKNAFEYRYKTSKGLNEEIVREISEEKNEPKWMLDYRLKALEIFNNSKNPVWGPDLSDVNIEDITTYIRPKADLSTSWEVLPSNGSSCRAVGDVQSFQSSWLWWKYLGDSQALPR